VDFVLFMFDRCKWNNRSDMVSAGYAFRSGLLTLFRLDH